MSATRVFPGLLAALATWDAEALINAAPQEMNVRDFADSSSAALSDFAPTDPHIYYETIMRLKGRDQPWKRSPKRDAVKMVVGVFTALDTPARNEHIRRLVRNGWMLHPDVCSLSHEVDMKIVQGPYSDCTIHVVFVAGEIPANKKGDSPEPIKWKVDENFTFLRYEPDVLVLPIKENMNEGKTFTWLQFAAQHFEWADYIGKADDDAFLHAFNLIESVPLVNDTRDESICPNAFLGRPWTCVNDAQLCPPQSCGPPVGHDFLAYSPSDTLPDVPGAGPDCWSYMQGAFYALTRPMAKDITTQGGFFDQRKIGYEDCLTGAAVHEYAKRTGKCVYSWDSKDITHNRILHHISGRRHEHPGVPGTNHVWDKYTEWW